MKEENFRRYNKFGYCKFGNSCFRRHEDKDCEVKVCLFRHPRKCRFFLEYNYCKFGSYCRFKHEAFSDKKTLQEINKLRKELEAVKLNIIEKETEIKCKEKEIEITETTLKKKYNNLEENMKHLETENNELKQSVKELIEKCETLNNTVAVNDMIHESFKEKVRIKYLYDSNV